MKQLLMPVLILLLCTSILMIGKPSHASQKIVIRSKVSSSPSVTVVESPQKVIVTKSLPVVRYRYYSTTPIVVGSSTVVGRVLYTSPTDGLLEIPVKSYKRKTKTYRSGRVKDEIRIRR